MSESLKMTRPTRERLAEIFSAASDHQRGTREAWWWIAAVDDLLDETRVQADQLAVLRETLGWIGDEAFDRSDKYFPPNEWWDFLKRVQANIQRVFAQIGNDELKKWLQ